MKRVVITGMGINSCIGNTLEDVNPLYKTGFQEHVLIRLMLN